MSKFFVRFITGLFALGIAVVPAPAAQAAAGDMTCLPGTTSQTVTFDPALTMTPQDGVHIHVNRIFAGCTSISHPDIVSGTSVSDLIGNNRSCLSLLTAASNTFTIVWNTGATSTIAENYTVTIAGAVIVYEFTGVVTAGVFAGDTVLRTLTGPSIDVTNCTLGLGTVSSYYLLGSLTLA